MGVFLQFIRPIRTKRITTTRLPKYVIGMNPFAKLHRQYIYICVGNRRGTFDNIFRSVSDKNKIRYVIVIVFLDNGSIGETDHFSLIGRKAIYIVNGKSLQKH